MRNSTIKMITDDSGEEYPNSFWHLLNPISDGGNNILCTNKYIGFGESSAEFIERKGEITCPKCIDFVKRFKRIKI